MTSLLAQTARSEAALCPTPIELDAKGCRCYAPDQLQKLADGLMELKVCRDTLVEKEALIQAELVGKQANVPNMAWWQEPKVVIGGVVITASAASLLTLWLTSKK